MFKKIRKYVKRLNKYEQVTLSLQIRRLYINACGVFHNWQKTQYPCYEVLHKRLRRKHKRLTQIYELLYK